MASTTESAAKVRDMEVGVMLERDPEGQDTPAMTSAGKAALVKLIRQARARRRCRVQVGASTAMVRASNRTGGRHARRWARALKYDQLEHGDGESQQ